jgi:sugar/nucleoside kinase (ribokinase family)
MSLIVTGSIGIDSIETPTGNADDVLGGSSIYFAAAASYFGPVRLVGAVGDDFPDHFRETFEHFDIDLEGLEKRAGSKTFRWRGRYHANMNDRDTLETQLNVLGEALPPVPQAYRDSEYIFLANTHPSGQLELLSNFPKHKLAVADTMDLWIKTTHDELCAMLKQVNGLVLNDSEATLLTDQTNMMRAAEKIVAMGPAFVVIKRGEHGALLYHQDGQVNLPAYPSRDVIDPTGAGDSFAGGMLGYLAAQNDTSFDAIKRAIAYGTVVASYNIEAFSLERLKQITRDDVNERYKRYQNMLAL